MVAAGSLIRPIRHWSVSSGTGPSSSSSSGPPAGGAQGGEGVGGDQGSQGVGPSLVPSVRDGRHASSGDGSAPASSGGPSQ